MSKDNSFPSKNQILMYEVANNEARVEVLHEGETVWLSQAQMAQLFNRDRSVITKHIKNVYESGELDEAATSANFALVQKEGSRSIKRELVYYNLDMIISVGYRVNSYRGTQFRIWATKTLREYLIKGFVMDDDRLVEDHMV